METEDIAKFSKKIHFIDMSGGNALAIIEGRDVYEALSTRMAAEILRETYSLRLVYAAVECTSDFSSDYEAVNRKLGKMKSEMPEVCHTGAFSICKQDYVTGFPVSVIKTETKKDGNKIYRTQESELKLNTLRDKYKDAQSSGQKLNSNTHIDDYIEEKGEDSHIAVIHIDGNNMGERIGEILKTAVYDEEYGSLRDVFNSVCVSQTFSDVCNEVIELVDKYSVNDKKTEENKEENKEEATCKPLVYSIISAGDDVTFITRANIALPFTKLFLKKISERNLYRGKETDHSKYEITACAGIAFVKSHFPFSDAYRLAEGCCAQAKKISREHGRGNWVDFEICTHVKDTDVMSKRKKYGLTLDTDGKSANLYMRPYCVLRENTDTDEENKEFEDFFDFEKLEIRISELSRETDDSQDSYNRSRSKALRQAYADGGNAVSNFKSLAESRGYQKKNYFEKISEKIGDKIIDKNYAVYYDAIDIMDLYDGKFAGYVNGIIHQEKGGN